MRTLPSTTKQLAVHRGFTLIELLVTFSVLIIIVAITLQSFASYARTQQFKRFVDEVGYSLTAAREQTLASKDDTVYGVYIGTSTVELFSGTTPVPGAASNEVLSFEDTLYSATSSLSTGEWFIRFERLTGEASATGTIILSSPTLGQTATVTVHQSGLVE